jgi:hypothetical protein
VVVHNAPNWAFEFVCDGHLDDELNPNGTDYISKLVMVDSLAYEDAAAGLVKSGGSLLLGGGGTNNNIFERCEFNGPGFGWYRNVADCYPTRNSTSVSAHGADNFAEISPGDEVVGMGLSSGTTVSQVLSGTQIVLSKPAVATFAFPSQSGTTLSFYRPSATQPSSVWLRRGAVHLVRTLVTRMHNCSFQGPGTSPALSTDLVSGHLVIRDCYREKLGDTDPQSALYHSFVVNGMQHLLIDSLLHNFHTKQSLVLRTGPAGLLMGRISNALLLCGSHGAGAIYRTNATDEILVDNAVEQAADRRDVTIGAALLELTPQVAGADVGSLVLPNGSFEIFRIHGTPAPPPGVGTNPITKIIPVHANRRIVLLFTDSTELTDHAMGGNLRLAGSFSGGNTRSITLVCDGTVWIELSRSAFTP